MIDFEVWEKVPQANTQLKCLSIIEESGEMKKIKGTFDVKAIPQTPDQNLQKMNAMSMMFEKTFRGELEAQSKVSMMGIMNKEFASGGYVALEMVDATLEKKKGSFVLQHFSFMNRGNQEQSVRVIPDSATHELLGLSGEMTIEIKEGLHFYVFEYSL